MVVVKRLRSRPCLLSRNSDSLSTIRTQNESDCCDGVKHSEKQQQQHFDPISSSSFSSVSSSLKGSHHSNTSSTRSKSHDATTTVCFALDYETGESSTSTVSSSQQQHEKRHPNAPSLPTAAAADDVVIMTPEEVNACFYTRCDLERFDKDRSLTLLMYQTRRSNGVTALWDDNLHSLRGLEEITACKNINVKPRRERRTEHVQAVLTEQTRLNSPAGQDQLRAASRTIKKTPTALYEELLRGVSCSHSKLDKQRALAIAVKDEKASGLMVRQGSGRRLLNKVKNKISGWSSTSNRSVASSMSTTSSLLEEEHEQDHCHGE